VQDLRHLDAPRQRTIDRIAFEHRAQAAFGETADADGPLRLQHPQSGGQMPVAGFVHRAALGRGQLVGGEVAAGVGQEHQRAVVQHEALGEEGLGAAEAQRRPAPQAPPADLGARAIEAFDRPLRVLVGRSFDRRADAHPVAHRGDFAEGHAGLHHAEGPRVHAQQYDALVRGAKAFDVGLVGGERVLQRVVDMRHRRREAQRGQVARQCVRGGDQLARDR